MIRSVPRTPAHEYACWTRKLDGKGDSNSDSNGASQPPPWTHNSIQPRLDLIARTGRPLRLKSGRSAVHPAPGQRADGALRVYGVLDSGQGGGSGSIRVCPASGAAAGCAMAAPM